MTPAPQLMEAPHPTPAEPPSQGKQHIIPWSAEGDSKRMLPTPLSLGKAGHAPVRDGKQYSDGQHMKTDKKLFLKTAEGAQEVMWMYTRDNLVETWDDIKIMLMATLLCIHFSSCTTLAVLISFLALHLLALA